MLLDELVLGCPCGRVLGVSLILETDREDNASGLICDLPTVIIDVSR